MSSNTDIKSLSPNSTTSMTSSTNISSITVTDLFPDITADIGSNILSQNQSTTVHPLSIDPKPLAHLVINSSALSNFQKSGIIRLILCGISDETGEDASQISSLLSSVVNSNFPVNNRDIISEVNIPFTVDKKINFDAPVPVQSPMSLATAAIDQLKTSNDCLEPLLRIMLHKQQQHKINSVVNIIWNKLVNKMALTSATPININNNANYFPTTLPALPNLPTIPLKMRPRMSTNSISTLNTYDNVHNTHILYGNGSKKKFDSLKPFLCSHPGCWRRFKHQTNLRIHSVIHGPQALQCRFCAKKFARKSNLSQHLRVHTGERPFVCALCNRGFKQLHSMKAHVLIHSRESCHVCDICMNYFQSANDLRKHQRMVHTIRKNTTSVNDNKMYVDEENVMIMNGRQLLL